MSDILDIGMKVIWEIDGQETVCTVESKPRNGVVWVSLPNGEMTSITVSQLKIKSE